MKRFTFLFTLIAVISCGDWGSSSNNNTSNQVLNPEPSDCETVCLHNIETGETQVSQSCSGGFLSPAPQGITVEDCTSFLETVNEEEEE